MKLHPLTVPAGVLSFGLLAAAGLMSLRVTAGPLNPPSGAVSPTYKTLSEVEPRIAINATNTPGDADATPSLFKITQPGSYYLTGNVTGVSGKFGIEIAASGVTLDLNGFELLGVAGSRAGVTISSSNPRNVAVRNGSVRGWGENGVALSAVSSSVADLRVSDNAGSGISMVGACMASGCQVYGNGDDGIQAGVACMVLGCTAYNNGSAGISAMGGCTISDSTVYFNAGDGVAVLSGCTISGCTAYNNLGNGISATAGATVSGCTSRSNTLDGVRVSSDCRVTDNTCVFNGVGDGAGIHATSDSNRIEGNLCKSADRGIDVDGTGNIIMRNTCTANTINWTIVGGNSYLVVVANRTVSNFSGDAGGGGYGSTDPNANFTY